MSVAPGQRFGRLVVVSVESVKSPSGKTRRMCECTCDCGVSKSVRDEHLRSGNIQSCGCLWSERRGKSSITHGDCRGGRGNRSTAEYRIWRNMRSRCNLSTWPEWHLYGGRGIEVCDRWQHSYENFLADMGRRPSSSHSIDRIDVNGNYEPGNCRWATPAEQRANQRPRGSA